MKPPDRLTQRATFRSGLIAFGAMTCLAVSLACEQRVRVAASAASANGVSSPASAAGETNGMKRIALSLMVVAIVTGVVAAWPQTSTPTAVKPGIPSAKEIRGASPYTEIKNEPAPRLFVDPPLPDLLGQGVVWIQWRVENVNILPVFGKGALHVSPRVGHLHVPCGRRAVVVGRRKQYQHDRLGRFAAWPAQDPGRTGGRQPSALPGPIEDGHVHHTQGRAALSLSLSGGR